MIADEVLVITTPEEAETQAEIRIYKVDGLLEENEDASDLALVLTETLKTRTAQAGGPVARDIHAPKKASPRQVTAYGKLLIVRDTTIGHRRVTNLLTVMQRGVEATRPVEEEATIIPIPTRPMPADRAPPRRQRDDATKNEDKPS